MAVRKNHIWSTVYVLIPTAVCFVLLYIVYFPRNSTTEMIASDESQVDSLSSDETCYLPNGDTYKRNHLRKLVVTNVDTQSAYKSANEAANLPLIPKNFSTLEEFISNTRKAFLSRRLAYPTHTIPTIFRNPPYKDMVRPSCDGLWMEFGVFRGRTLTMAANWKKQFCGLESEPVYGFDTFEGLPEDWKPGYKRGHFRIQNWTALKVPSNTILVKGLFIDTLPTQLALIDQKYNCYTPVSYVHIDCDLYAGSKDVLFLLGNRFVPGTILVFDELFNYPAYRLHEVKALFESVVGLGLKLAPLGTRGDILLDPVRNGRLQSFGFIAY